MKKIPITIGITGHRDIRSDAIDCLKDLVRDEILSLKDKYSHSDFVMVNALASGADLLCADVAMELGLDLIAVLPLEKNDYLADFNNEDKVRFERALSYSFNTIDLSGVPGDRDDHYRLCGEYIADHSNLTFALWDGKTDNPSGCGTGGIMHYITTQSPAYSVFQFLTPKSGDTFSPSVAFFESESGITSSMLETIDSFNGEELNNDLYSSSDFLSINYQKKYNKSLLAMSSFGVLMVLAFLLYDELNLKAGIFVYALFFLLSAGLLAFLKRKRYHEKYYKCRMLAECLRVQRALGSLNIGTNAASFYTWTHQDEILWIKKTMDYLQMIPTSKENHDCSLWITGQLEYNKSAAVRTERKMKRGKIFSFILIVVTALVILTGCILELIAPQLFATAMDKFDFGTLYKIAAGTLSAASLFMSSYFGKLALGRKLEDHQNMIRLYSRAKRLIDENGLSDSLALSVAREEIIENGNWYSYIKENTPDINI